MSRRFVALSVIGLTIGCASGPAYAATVGFESLVVGTSWGGSAGDRPGDTIFSEDDISVSVENFVLGTFTGFNSAAVAGPSVKFPSQSLLVNNISLDFDFTGLTFDVDAVTFEFANSGGADNLSVNGGAIFEGPLGLAPMAIAPGVTLTYFDDGDPNHSFSGMISLAGDINSVRIGGQELQIDNIVATPEPASLAIFGLGVLVAATGRRTR